MQFRLQKSAFVAIGLTRAVIILVTLPLSAQGHNSPVPLDYKHRGVKLEKGQKGQAVPA